MSRDNSCRPLRGSALDFCAGAHVEPAVHDEAHAVVGSETLHVGGEGFSAMANPMMRGMTKAPKDAMAEDQPSTGPAQCGWSSSE